MGSYRRSVVMAAMLMAMFFFLYPRNQSDPESTTTSNSRFDSKKPLFHKALIQGNYPYNNMGIGSPKQQQRLAVSSIKKSSVSEQLSHHFPYDISSKFPAFIWQTWKWTPASGLFEERFRITEASWTEKHPGFIHEVITDSVAEQLIAHLYAGIPDVLEAYRSMPLPILKIDLFRYLILYARGGIYADIDTFALKPASEWIPPVFNLKSIGLVIGIEADPDREDWARWYSRRVQFCQWTIQAKPGHPVLRDIISRITEETLKRKRNGTLKPDHKGVVEFTGPAAWTDSVFSYFNDPRYFDMTESDDPITPLNFTGMKAAKMVGDVVVLPITSFSPGIGHSGAGEVEDPMAFVKHEFAGSWKPEKERLVEPKKTPEQEAAEKAEAEKQAAAKVAAAKVAATKEAAQKEPISNAASL